jgi:phage terminase large subunit
VSRTRAQLIGDFQRWAERPDLFVRDHFKVEPDAWQDEILRLFPHEPMIAMQACKGPGKTTCLAWLGWNFLATRDEPNIAATSISGDNLRDGLWKEMAKWQRESTMLTQLFQWTTTRIFYKSRPETWFMSARTWPKTGDNKSQADTLAGLHADYILFLIDEGGGIPQSVVVTAEAALSSCKEGHLVMAGNPTDLDGALYAAAKDRKGVHENGRWAVREITADPDDPMRAPRVSPEWARSQIRRYGRDNPWVMVNVLGKFPDGTINSLLSEDDVKAAMKRHYRPHDLYGMAKVLGVDVAREGLDASVIFPRQGLQAFPMHRYRNVANGVAGASITSRIWDEFEADAVFVDATGGHGFPWIDQLVVLGKQPIPVAFNSKAHQDDRYYNRRAEMYFLLANWVKNEGGALPPEETEGSIELMQALTKTTFLRKKNTDKLILEDKEQIREKLGFSPDEADALALTFAEKVTPKARTRKPAYTAMQGDYRAFTDVERGLDSGYGAKDDYNPYR